MARAKAVDIRLGDCLAVLRKLPSDSVHCCVTSPPYWGLRDYGVPGQLGLEPTPEEFTAHLVEVFAEVRRVLRPEGTCWLNLGDSYATGGGKVRSAPGGGAQGDRWKGYRGTRGESPKHVAGAIGPMTQPNRMPIAGLKPKDLVGIPWRVAFALQADGWYLRSDVIWHKPNPMPESVRDRPTKSHEYLFLLAKRGRYYYDADAVREPTKSLDPKEASYRPSSVAISMNGRVEHSRKHAVSARSYSPAGRNRRSVWSVTTKPFKGAHFAVFPPDLIEPCILAGTSEKGCCPHCGEPWKRITKRERFTPQDYAGKHSAAAPQHSGRRILANVHAARAAGHPHDNPFPAPITLGWKPSCACPPHEPVPCLVLDPFAGAGTTGLVAQAHGRHFLGIELNADYRAMALERIAAARRKAAS